MVKVFLNRSLQVEFAFYSLYERNLLMHVLHQAGRPEVDNQIVVEIPMKIKKQAIYWK